MLILASQSEIRASMLQAAGLAFETCPARIDERAAERDLGSAAPDAVATHLAVTKALAVSVLHPGKLILGSDSLIEVAGKRFNKPASREDAASHLRFFSGKTMHLHSGAALVRDGRILWQGSSLARLWLRPLSDSFIDAYLDHEWPAVSACVGVFRIEGRGVQLFEKIEGDQFTVQGMPLLQVLQALRDLKEIPA